MKESKFAKFKDYTKGVLFGAASDYTEDESENNEDINENYDREYSSSYNFDDVESSYSGSNVDYTSSYSSSSELGGSYNSTVKSFGGNLHKMSGSSKPKFKLSILRLEKLEDAVKVADNILAGNTITLLDFHYVQKEVMRRIIDFLDGVRYTCGAKMECVADYTYVVVPKDVELTGDLFNKIDTTNLD